MDSLERGLVGPQPPTVTAEERNMWQRTDEALASVEVGTLTLSPMTRMSSTLLDVLDSPALMNGFAGILFEVLDSPALMNGFDERLCWYCA